MFVNYSKLQTAPLETALLTKLRITHNNLVQRASRIIRIVSIIAILIAFGALGAFGASKEFFLVLCGVVLAALSVSIYFDLKIHRIKNEWIAAMTEVCAKIGINIDYYK